MKYCIYCGAEASDDAKFCPRCGKAFACDTLKRTEVASSQAVLKEEKEVTFEKFAWISLIVAALACIVYVNYVVIILSAASIGLAAYALYEIHLHPTRKGRGFAWLALILGIIMLALSILSAVSGDTIASFLASLAQSE